MGHVPVFDQQNDGIQRGNRRWRRQPDSAPPSYLLNCTYLLRLEDPVACVLIPGGKPQEVDPGTNRCAAIIQTAPDHLVCTSDLRFTDQSPDQSSLKVVNAQIHRTRLLDRIVELGPRAYRIRMGTQDKRRRL